MEWLDSLRIIFGFVVAAVSFTALIWKKPRRWILGYFKRKRREKIQEIEDAVLKVFAPKFEDIKKQIEDLADKNEENHQQVMANAEKTDIIIEVQKQILRNSIKGLYEKGMTQGYLTKYDK